ncbi:MAG: hypothetical protein J6T96_12195 [Bacteroidales bacterium]|nr:hypothetical protein [Bacteroidales bacterium]
MNISLFGDWTKAYGGAILHADEKGYNLLTRRNVWFQLDDDIKQVETGFLERIPHLEELAIGLSVEEIGVSSEADKLMHHNHVIIRGDFDTYAEEFAMQHHLGFVPMDFEITRNGDVDTKYGLDILTIEFYTKEVNLRMDNFCPGSSAGNYGGGTIDKKIPVNFYKDPDAITKIAELSWRSFSDGIRNSDRLKNFVEKARKKYAERAHDGLLINY